MPQPHEQKLQEVVNSLTFDSLNVFEAAWTVCTSRSPLTASPAPAPMLTFSQSRRLRRVDGASRSMGPRIRTCRQLAQGFWARAASHVPVLHGENPPQGPENPPIRRTGLRNAGGRPG